MTPDEVRERLAEPFAPTEVKWKPQSVKGSRALAVCYVDARLVQDRLDDVFGVGGWQDEYTPLPNGSVLCRLRVKVGGEWVAKQDVGSESEQPDEHDRTKAAFSDALKRVAVKYGIGRYLYRLGHQWCDYDPAKRRFVATPQLPAWALPKKPAADHTPYPEREPDEPQPVAKPTAKKADGPATLKALYDGLGKKDPPATAGDLVGRVVWVDRQLGRLLAGHHVGGLADSVCQFARVEGLPALGDLMHKQDVVSAWNNAMQFVKGSLDAQGKQAGR
jgi:hypothetical protein